HFVIARFAGGVAFGRKFDGLFQCGHLPRPLFASLGKAFAGNQRIRDVTKGGKSGLPIPKQGFIPHSLGLAVLTDQTPSFKSRASRVGGYAPGVGAARSERRKFRADPAEKRSQADPWEKFRNR